MLRSLRLTLLTASLACAQAAAAQSVLETVWSDARTVPGDLWYVWSGPLRLEAEDASGIATFTGLTLFIGLNDLQIQELIRAGSNTAPMLLIEPFRAKHETLSRLGQNHWVLRGAGAGYIIGIATGQDWLRESSLGCALGNIANALPRSAVYRLIARPRPSHQDDPYDIDVPGGGWGVHSFFGGHAANAFTCASFLAHRWDLGWGEPVAWTLAGGVALARTADEAHWASDTFVGSVFGYVIGRMIATRHLERAERERAGDAEPGSGAADRPDADGMHAWRLEDVAAWPVRASDGTPALILSARVRF